MVRISLRVGFLLVLLLACIYLLINRQLLDDNLYALRRGQVDLHMDLKRLSGQMTEDDVRTLAVGLSLRCNPMAKADESLGERVCDGWVRSFNGVRAYQVAFFFRNGALCNAKIDVPWWQHRRLGRDLVATLGRPHGRQDMPHAGVRLVGWKLAQGNILYNRDADINPLWWNTVLWVSPEEAARRGGIFVPEDTPVWGRGLVDLAMFLFGMAVER